jgi:hypothetical protein
MGEELYCIVDVTIGLDAIVEGTTGMTMEAADAWIKENQIRLEESITIDGVEFDSKYVYKFE